ncbi:uncharacterized protein LOC142312383 [Anomaloglossus baeobatrachus]|uniref:uncharacterized protein LOC142312383 n=1 Tax=Anomaloglossus baeobatrachus TaxID=238106 RepID=UPI003F4FA71E
MMSGVKRRFLQMTAQWKPRLEHCNQKTRTEEKKRENMPSCLVKDCLSSMGHSAHRSDVILHRFPKDVNRIKDWLLAMGQEFSNIDELVQKISTEAAKNKKYRLCSCHFASDCYIQNVGRRILLPNANPSIFHCVPDGECLINENLKKKRGRRRKRPLPRSEVAGAIQTDNLTMSENQNCSEDNDTRYVSIGIQTDLTMQNSSITYTESVDSQYQMAEERIVCHTTPDRCDQRQFVSTPHESNDCNSKKIFTIEDLDNHATADPMLTTPLFLQLNQKHKNIWIH